MLLRIRGLRKRFGGLQAVDNVDLDVERGEILGLIGPNGSGKSTVMNLVMGVHRPDSGSILVDGVETAGQAPNHIAARGVSMVFQHSRPLQQQTILQNLYLALLPNRLLNLRMAPGVERTAREILEKVGLGAVADRLPSELPFAGLRRLELAKSLARRPSVLLLDEPFAGLSASETREFSALVRELHSPERAIILVDHNVKGVRALVDRMAAMSAGQKIADDAPDAVLADANVRKVYLGAGASVDAAALEAPSDPQAALAVDRLSVRYGKSLALDSVSLRVPKGSVTAVVGLNGAGKSSLFNAICGIVPSEGEIRFDDRSIKGVRPETIARSGVVLCPETRELFGDMTVAENLKLGGHHMEAAALRERLSYVEHMFPRLAERRAQYARTLSGGEQQQLAIGRALMMKPSVLLIDEPTLGLAPIILDVISEAIEAIRAEGNMSLLLSEQNMTFALRHANLVYLLEQGSVRWSGPSQTFVSEIGTLML